MNTDTSAKNQHLLFIGIVGHAMRGIAVAAKQRGNHVTGLDDQATPGPATDWLASHGIEWSRTPDAKQLDGVDVIIISGATPADYPLLEEARRRGIRIISFAQYLGDLTAGKRVIAVAGTHGKTTTTSLVTWLLESAGRRPDYLIGIRPFNFESSARLNDADTFVVEGDEYRASHLDTRSKVQYYHPDVVVLTSVEHDHPDTFPTLESVIDRFKEIVAAVPKAGRLVAWAEDKTVAAVAKAAACEVVTYGLDAGDFQAKNISYEPAGITFDVERSGRMLGRVTVPLYGRHNVLNALAAVAVAMGEGLALEQIIAGAASFKGAFRRFQLLAGPGSAIAVVDDYAHHPTEVRVTLEAARLHFAGRRIIAVFRPHTYSRTKALLREYQQSFAAADCVYITGIEGARETSAAQTVSGQDIAQKLTMPTRYVEDRAELASRIAAGAAPGDVIVCMTVSGYDDIAGELAKKLSS